MLRTAVFICFLGTLQVQADVSAQYKCPAVMGITGSFSEPSKNYPGGISCSWNVYVPDGSRFVVESTVEMNVVDTTTLQEYNDWTYRNGMWTSPFLDKGNYSLSIDTNDNTTLMFNVYVQPVCEKPTAVATFPFTYPKKGNGENYPVGIQCSWNLYIPEGNNFVVKASVPMEISQNGFVLSSPGEGEGNGGWTSNFHHSGNYSLSINSEDNITLHFTVYLQPVCLQTMNVTSSTTYPSSSKYYPVGIICDWEIFVPAGKYLKIQSTYSPSGGITRESDTTGTSNGETPSTSTTTSEGPLTYWNLDGTYTMKIDTQSNITLHIIFEVKPLPTRTLQTVRLPVAAPAQLINISSLATSNYYFTTNNDFEGVGVALSVAVENTQNPPDMTQLKSCFALISSDGNGLYKQIRTRLDTLTDTLNYDDSPLSPLKSLNNNCTVTCLENVNFPVYLVAQEMNNLLGISLHSTWLLSNFSYTSEWRTQRTDVVTVINPSPNMNTRLVAVESANTDDYVNVADSSPQKVSNISYPVGSGPIDISGQMVTFRFPMASGTKIFIVPSSEAAGPLCLTLLSIFVLFRQLF